jgi:hypothetical protein
MTARRRWFRASLYDLSFGFLGEPRDAINAISGEALQPASEQLPRPPDPPGRAAGVYRLSDLPRRPADVEGPIIASDPKEPERDA